MKTPASRVFGEQHELAPQKAADEAHNERGSTKQSIGRGRDEVELFRLGKIPVLKRSHGFLPILGFTCSILITWKGSLITLGIGLENGGPAGIIYMFIFAWTGAWCVSATLSELASMAPVSAGQYFWVAMLAPTDARNFLSYVTGWNAVIGWQALTAPVVYISGTVIQALVVLTVPSYSPTNWQGTLIIWAVLLLAIGINTGARTLLPRLQFAVLTLHILAFFGIMIPLVVLSSHRESADVWTQFNNGGGWPTQGLSTMIGLLMPLILFTGVDGAFHMSEETKSASTTVPRSIMVSMALNGSFGLAILLAALYALGDIETVLSSPTGAAAYPFLDILRTAVGSVRGAAAMGSVIAVLQICAAITITAATSRMLWTFARDGTVLGWGIWVHLDRRTGVPARCVYFTAAISLLLSLINIGSTKAFNAIIGLCTAGYYTSYFMACSLLLWHRVRRGILPHTDALESRANSVNNSGQKLAWGPWCTSGAVGIIVNVWSCIYLIISLFWSFWPSETPVTAKNMNYNVLVWGAVNLMATLYYLVHGRREYTGPIVEVTSTNDD